MKKMKNEKRIHKTQAFYIYSYCVRYEEIYFFFFFFKIEQNDFMFYDKKSAHKLLTKILQIYSINKI